MYKRRAFARQQHFCSAALFFEIDAKAGVWVYAASARENDVPGKIWTDDDIRRATAMRLAGVELRDIAAVLGRGADSVSEMLLRRGVRLPPELRREINMRNVGLAAGANRVPPPKPMDIDREATVRFELAYCAAAERNGWPIGGYRT